MTEAFLDGALRAAFLAFLVMAAIGIVGLGKLLSSSRRERTQLRRFHEERARRHPSKRNP